MKLKKLIAMSLVALSATGAYANNWDPCCDPCYDPCCDSGYDFTVYADYLYWNTRKNNLDYAMPENSSASENIGQIYEVCPNYQSGFRIGGRVGSCDKYLGARYTYFHNDYFDSITNLDGNLAATRLGSDDAQAAVDNGDIQFASGSYDIDYDVVDIELGYLWDDGCGSTARFFGGVKLAYIDQKLDVFYAQNVDDKEGNDNDIDNVYHKNDLNAYGLFVGGEGVWDLWCNLGLYGRTSVGALVGDVKRHYTHTFRSGPSDPETHVDLHDECHRLISELEIAAGLNYDICDFGCGDWFIQIGYEFHQWWNMSDFINVLSNNNGDEHRLDHSNGNIGFDGLFVRLGASF